MFYYKSQEENPYKDENKAETPEERKENFYKMKKFKAIEKVSNELHQEQALPPSYGGLGSQDTVMISVNFRDEILQILQQESDELNQGKKKKKHVKRTFKELVKNMQEMVMLGAGIHTKIFKPRDN